MMSTRVRRLTVGAAAVLLLTMTARSQSGGSWQAPTVFAAEDATRERAVLDEYCVGCHNQKLMSGGLRLDNLDVADIGNHAEVGEKIVRKLRAGVMPPPDVKRPDKATYEFLAGSLEKRLDQSAAASPTFTPPGPHRLNRREYANAVYDLLGMDVDPGSFLPVDDTSDGFDNIASALNTSPALVESYVSAAAKISRLALGHENSPSQKVYVVPSDLSQTHHMEGMEFGTRGGLLVHHRERAAGGLLVGLERGGVGDVDLHFGHALHLLHRLANELRQHGVVTGGEQERHAHLAAGGRGDVADGVGTDDVGAGAGMTNTCKRVGDARGKRAGHDQGEVERNSRAAAMTRSRTSSSEPAMSAPAALACPPPPNCFANALTSTAPVLRKDSFTLP